MNQCFLRVLEEKKRFQLVNQISLEKQQQHQQQYLESVYEFCFSLRSAKNASETTWSMKMVNVQTAVYFMK